MSVNMKQKSVEVIFTKFDIEGFYQNLSTYSNLDKNQRPILGTLHEDLWNYRMTLPFLTFATFSFPVNNLKRMDVSMSFIIPSSEHAC
jgi:hypothetical protein